jgi:hypothetical protein
MLDRAAGASRTRQELKPEVLHVDTEIKMSDVGARLVEVHVELCMAKLNLHAPCSLVLNP